MATAAPLATAPHPDASMRSLCPALEALARAPLGEEDMTPDQQAAFAQIVADFEAGRARLVDNDDVPGLLYEMARAQGK